jgi:hypothetical protein
LTVMIGADGAVAWTIGVAASTPSLSSDATSS